MASDRQIEANRRNAKRSTGPKTDQGKIRSSQNAHRHGLSRSMADKNVGIDPQARAVLYRLQQEALLNEPEVMVESKLELARIRAVRHKLLAAFLAAPDPALAKQIRGLARYESTAFAKQKRVIRTGNKSASCDLR